MASTDHQKAAKIDALIKKVLGTTELLESILLHVDDYQTLLLSQRVCRNFQATTEKSTPLQHALFFKMYSDTHPAIPPILRHRTIKIREDGASVCLSYDHVLPGLEGLLRFRRAHTPGRRRPTTFEGKESRDLKLERGCTVDLHLDMEHPLGDDQRANVEYCGSWQRIMLQNARASVLCYSRSGSGICPINIPLSESATMGDLVELALHVYSKSNSGGNSAKNPELSSVRSRE